MINNSESKFHDLIGSLGAIIIVVASIYLIGTSIGIWVRIPIYVLGAFIVLFALPGIFPFLAVVLSNKDVVSRLIGLPDVGMAILKVGENKADEEPDNNDNLFDAIYKKIYSLDSLSNESKLDLIAEINELREELAMKEQANEDFLTRRLRHIGRTAPDILEITLATITNPLAGFGLVAKQIVQKIKPINIYVGKNTTSDKFVIASEIQKSFNIAQEANIQPELKETLKQLVDAVDAMNNALPNERAEEVAGDLEKLIEEAIKETPNRKWYMVSIDSLIRAAENLEGIGEPVKNLSQKVLSILTRNVWK